MTSGPPLSYLKDHLSHHVGLTYRPSSRYPQRQIWGGASGVTDAIYPTDIFLTGDMHMSASLCTYLQWEFLPGCISQISPLPGLGLVPYSHLSPGKVFLWP